MVKKERKISKIPVNLKYIYIYNLCNFQQILYFIYIQIVSFVQ